MSAISEIDFDRADHRQRKAVRVALLVVFQREQNIEMFLDDVLGFAWHEEVATAPFQGQIHHLVELLASRGQLSTFMRALFSHES